MTTPEHSGAEPAGGSAGEVSRRSPGRSRCPLVLLTIVVIAGVLLAVFFGGSLLPRSSEDADPVDRVESKPGFADATAAVGIDFEMHFLPNEQGATFKINLYDHGCGIAVGDYDGDGHEDLYLLNQLGANALFRNSGKGTFEDVTEAMGVGLADRICVAATFADYDNDGDQDLFVTSTRGGNVLFQNDDNRRLVDVTAAAGLEHVGHSQTAAFFDYDNDGYLDLYVLHTAGWTTEAFDRTTGYFPGKGDDGFEAVIHSPPEFNILYHNNQDGTFSDVTERSGLKGRGWSGDLAVFDFDEDGDLDVAVTCMFGPSQLYRNEGNGTFRDVTRAMLGATPWGGVGARVFDSNNDGKLDLYIVDMHSDMWMGADPTHDSLKQAGISEKQRFPSVFGPLATGPGMNKIEQEWADFLGYFQYEVIYGNALYEYQPGGRFIEVSGRVGLETLWPWGIATGDFDNDGDQDVFLASGMGFPLYYWRNYLLMNADGRRFIDESGVRGIDPPPGGRILGHKIAFGDLGELDCPRSSRCAVTADFDQDGRLDLVVNNFNDRAYYYRNVFPGRNYIAFRLTGHRCNRDAIGARVRLRLGERTLIRLVHPAGGYLSHSSRTLHFGLGENREAIESAEVIWPDGRVQRLPPLEVNRLHRITESGGEADGR